MGINREGHDSISFVKKNIHMESSLSTVSTDILSAVTSPHCHPHQVQDLVCSPTHSLQQWMSLWANSQSDRPLSQAYSTAWNTSQRVHSPTEDRETRGEFQEDILRGRQPSDHYILHTETNLCHLAVCFNIRHGSGNWERTYWKERSSCAYRKLKLVTAPLPRQVMPNL